MVIGKTFAVLAGCPVFFLFLHGGHVVVYLSHTFEGGSRSILVLEF